MRRFSWLSSLCRSRCVLRKLGYGRCKVVNWTTCVIALQHLPPALVLSQKPASPTRRGLLLLVALIGSGCVSQPSQLHLEQTRRGPYLQPATVETSIDGFVATLVVDTAARVSVIDKESFRKCGDIQPSRSCVFGESGVQYIAQSVPLGRRHGATNVAFLVHDLADLKRRTAFSFDGILGANILNLVTYEFDASRGVLEITAPNSIDSETGVEIANQEGWIYVAADFGGFASRFILDSGAANSRIDAATARALLVQGLGRKEEGKRYDNWIDFSGTVHEADVLESSVVQVDDCTLHNMRFLVGDRNLLGIDFLEACTATVDAKAGRAVFKSSGLGSYSSNQPN